MKGTRFSEEPIIGILREQEPGMATAEVCRRHGISGRDLLHAFVDLRHEGVTVANDLAHQAGQLVVWRSQDLGDKPSRACSGNCYRYPAVGQETTHLAD